MHGFQTEASEAKSQMHTLCRDRLEATKDLQKSRVRSQVNALCCPVIRHAWTSFVWYMGCGMPE